MAHPWLERLDQMVSAWHLKRCHNIADLRQAAYRRVPAPMFGYMDGAAGDEVTLRRNIADFSDYELLPRYLVDVENIDPSTTVLGSSIDMPLIMAPTGMPRLFHHHGELATARAVERANTIYSLSTVSTYSIEDVAAVSKGPKWFQMYVLRDRDLTSEFIERARAANYQAMCLTVDVPVPGNRERDLRTGMTIPPKLSLASWLSFFLHPLWSACHVTSEPFSLANLANRADVAGGDVTTIVGYINSQFDRTMTWEDAAWMIEQWNGPFAIKGIMTPHDALKAIEIGATGIIVSNHGGRQLDCAASSISVLAEIVEAVGDKAEVILDGGIRRGTDVIKALALGARACMTGRCHLFGLGAGGEAGVDHALVILRKEIEMSMALLGCRTVEEITGEYIRRYSGSA